MHDVTQQAGVIAFRRTPNAVELCLTLKRRGGSWKIPKGTVETGDSLRQTALAEALEEAGIRGQLIGAPLGAYNYKKRGNRYNVVMYLMFVMAQDDHWAEMGFRERYWVPPQAALHYLRKHRVQPILEQALGTLAIVNEIHAVNPGSPALELASAPMPITPT